MDWKAWFERYAADWASGEVDMVAWRYAPAFLVAKPGKSATYRNGDELLTWLRQVREFHVASGLERVEVVTLREVPLGENHALVSVTWAVRFQKTAALRIQFDISYTLALGEEPKIVAIVSHEDQRAAMRRYGLLR